MALTEKDISRKLSARRILIPIIIGLGAATWLLVSNLTATRFEKAPTGEGNYAWVDTNENGRVDKDDKKEFFSSEEGAYRKVTYQEVLSKVNWTWYSTFWMFMAIMMMVVRDVAYMYRIKVMTDDHLSWRQSFDVIMLWEFASAITPSIVGGSGIALFIVNREGVKMGRSTAVVMVTAMLDELFYILMVPILVVILGTTHLFPESLEQEVFGMELNTMGIFWAGYFFLMLLTLIITTAIFFIPRTIKYLLLMICRIPLLRKYRYKAMETGNDLIISSRELKGKPWAFWGKAFGATIFSWTGRYWVVNFIIMAFASSIIPFTDHLIIYARQLVVWVIMLISPTPGGSGIAEVAFSGFLKEFIPVGLAGALALIWRLISYYPYLFIGAIILPKWLKKTGERIRKAKEEAGERQDLKSQDQTSKSKINPKL